MSGRSLSFFVVACFAVLPATASADLVLRLESSTQLDLTAGTATTGFFDVFLSSDSLVTPDTISGYSVSLSITSLSGGTGVTFRNSNPVTPETSASGGPIFGAATNIFPFVEQLTQLSYLDSPSPPGSESIIAGTNYGAGRIYYEVAANATPDTFIFSFNPGTTTYFNGSDSQENFAGFLGGTLTVLPAPVPAPEPSSAILLGLTGIAGVTLRRFRRKSTPEA